MATKRTAKKKKSAGRSTKPAKTQTKTTLPVEFCKRCGSLMIPMKKGTTSMLKCRSCSYQIKRTIKKLKISEETPRKEGVIVLDKDNTMLPITDQVCPSCENRKAYWWMQQTRPNDEPPTQFFRCVRCRHVWREYK